MKSLNWERFVDQLSAKGYAGGPDLVEVKSWLASNGHDTDCIIDADDKEHDLSEAFAQWAESRQSYRSGSSPVYITKDMAGRKGWGASFDDAVDAEVARQIEQFHACANPTGRDTRFRGGDAQKHIHVGGDLERSHRPNHGKLKKGGAVDVTWFTKGAKDVREKLEHGGFDSLFDVVRAKHFHDKGSPLDDRISKALSTYANEGVGVDGGFLIPETIRYDLMQIERTSFPWMEGVTRKTTETNNLSLPFPRDYVRNTGTVAGVDMRKASEGSTLAQQKAIINMRAFRLAKRGSILPISNEHIEDAPANAWGGVLESIVGEEIAYENALQVFEGSGSGEMNGFLDSGACLEVAKEGGQAADSVTYNNVKAMWEAFDARSEARAIWCVSKSCFSQFAAFAENSDSVWMPNSADTPGRLFGRPVYWMDHTSAVLGDRGDVTLWDPSAYCIVDRPVRIDVSRDVFFEEDTTAYRYVYRADGSTIPNSTFTAGDGRTVAKFVVLAERA